MPTLSTRHHPPTPKALPAANPTSLHSTISSPQNSAANPFQVAWDLIPATPDDPFRELRKLTAGTPDELEADDSF